MVEGLGRGPRRQPEGLLAELQHLAQTPVGKHSVAREIDLLDLGLGSLADVKGHLALSLTDRGQASLGSRLQVSLLGQELLDGRLRTAENREVHRLPALHLALRLVQPFLDVGFGHRLHADERHVPHQRPVPHMEDQVVDVALALA